MKIVKNAVVLSLVVGAAAVAADANAALNAYVKFTGVKQGAIKGSVTTKGAETNSSLVFGFDLDTQVPVDAASGQASGKRQHSPFVITKAIDSASPALYSAIVNNEVLKTVELDVTSLGARGETTTLFKYVLTNAQIIDVHHSMTTPCVGSAPCKAAGPDGNIVGPDEPTETISLTYQKIEITYAGQTAAGTAGGATTSVEDGWNLATNSAE